MAWDSTWENVFQKQEWGKYPGEDLIRFVARNFYKVQNRKNIKILEIGCGTGANLWYIAREGFSVYGIDGSETAIRIAKQRLEEEILNFKADELGKHLSVADITSLPFTDNFFDAVIDNEAVYANSYESAKIIYREMLRVCKKKGKIFSRTFAEGTYGVDKGEKLGHNAWKTNVGPLTGKGYCRLTNYGEIEDLLQGSDILEINLLSRSIYGAINDQLVKEWIIIAEKC